MKKIKIKNKLKRKPSQFVQRRSLSVHIWSPNRHFNFSVFYLSNWTSLLSASLVLKAELLYSLHVNSLYRLCSPSSISEGDGPNFCPSGGPPKYIIDNLDLALLTITLCFTLLNLPFVRTYIIHKKKKKNLIFRRGSTFKSSTKCNTSKGSYVWTLGNFMNVLATEPKTSPHKKKKKPLTTVLCMIHTVPASVLSFLKKNLFFLFSFLMQI